MTARTSELRAAVKLALSGNWQGAHEIAQQYEDDLDACWLHAVVHRIEGDLSNARYWYARVGQPPHTGALDAEWRELVIAQLAALTTAPSRRK